MADDTANIYTHRQRHRLLVVILVGLGILVFLGLRSYVSAFLGAGVLYVVLRPWFTALVQGRGWNRQVVAALLLLFTVVVLVVPCYFFGTMLFSRMRDMGQYTDQVLAVVRRLEHFVRFDLVNEQSLRTLLGQVGGSVSRWVLLVAGNVTNFVIVIGLMLFTLYFMFVEEAAFLRTLRRYLPFRPETLARLQESLQNNVRANVLGQVLVAAVQGTLIGLTLWIFKVPDPVFWGAIGAFTVTIPVLGTPIVWVPAALYQFAHGEAGLAVGILLTGVIVIVNADNVLRMVLASTMGDIHPLVTLVGVTLGLSLFGILGLVIGPLLLSYCGVLMEVFAQENHRAQPVPELAVPGPAVPEAAVPVAA